MTDIHSGDVTDNGVLPLTWMMDVEPELISWIWKGVIPKGKLVALGGPVGVGKSMLTMDLIARATRKAAWPDGAAACEQMKCLLLAAEDNPNDTIRPRADAADVDLSKLAIIAPIFDSDAEYGRPFSFAKDLARLDATLKADPKIGLVVIDPIGSYLGIGVNSNDHDEMRAILTPLTALCAEHTVTILIVCHLNKRQEGFAADRFLGAGTWIQAARMAFIVGRNPEDRSECVLVPAKNNLASADFGYSFQIVEHENSARIEWSSEKVTLSPEEVLRPGVMENTVLKRDQAAEWLRSQLASGSMSPSDLKDAAKKEGICERTLERAAEILKVTKGTGCNSVWSLPSGS